MHSHLMEPKVIYEDSAFAVIDKPSGMTVNRADTTRGEVTLQDAIISIFGLDEPRIKVDEQGFRNAFLERSGIVHRLDKETSGLILVAKTESAFSTLQQQFKNRTVHKNYVALVHGEVKPGDGEINAPIGRESWNRMRFGVVAGGKEAFTKYQVLERRLLRGNKEKLSLVSLEPKTGRTHQIRVHMKYLGYPLFADFLYAGRKTQRDDRKYLARVFLHAAEISFSHPATGEGLMFRSDLPEELRQFLDEMTYVIE
jgi:23S rRNA pseudouridine1911/1915/1917 synthase